MTSMFWIWMAAAMIFLIIELLSPSFFFICFTAGAAVSGIYAYYRPEEYYWQIGIFVIVTVVLLPLSRKAAKKITKPSPQESNVDAMIGKTVLVTAPIDPDHGGKIRYEGEIWVALANEPIAENAKVKIVSVSGTKVHVERVG
jgi:membrane protein implicated in regulation of membrane protease activity